MAFSLYTRSPRRRADATLGIAKMRPAELSAPWSLHYAFPSVLIAPSI
jgi:hypothetical protein